MNDSAAKLPAAVTNIRTCGGASRRARLIVNAASPPPIAIRGASGPSTSPKARVAAPARMMPGRTFGPEGPLAERPLAGIWPPPPGSRVIASATSNEPTARTGSGHHVGGPLLIADGMREVHVQLLLELEDPF